MVPKSLFLSKFILTTKMVWFARGKNQDDIPLVRRKYRNSDSFSEIT